MKLVFKTFICNILDNTLLPIQIELSIKTKFDFKRETFNSENKSDAKLQKNTKIIKIIKIITIRNN